MTKVSVKNKLLPLSATPFLWYNTSMLELTNYLPFIKGFCTSAGLIMAIGVQNTFVLKHGIMKSHVLLIAILCSIIDAALIILGVGGAGKLIVSLPHLLHITKYGGAIFCFCYGGRAFYSALKSQNAIRLDDTNKEAGLYLTISTLLAVSFFNPHTYLDTVILIGSIGAQFQEEFKRLLFAIGAVTASSIWFFALAYGAGYLAPLFTRPFTWRLLDIFIGIVMWSIAGSLFWSA